MRLRADSPHVRVDAEKLQQRTGSSFLHADYNRLRKPFGPEGVGHWDDVALGALLCAVRCVKGQLSWCVHLLCVRGGCAVRGRRLVVEQARRRSQLVQNAAIIVQNVIVFV